MKTMLTRMAAVTAFVVSVVTSPAFAQTGGAVPVVTLPVEGRFALAGEFTGSVAINKFARRGNDIVAIGFIRGTLRRGNRTIGTVIAGEVTWPVALRVNGITVARNAEPAPARAMRAGWMLAQAQECPVLQIALFPGVVDLLGIDVNLSPIIIDLQGDPSQPLGRLVCAVSDLLGNVAGLVEALNGILGLITGLLGGLLP